MVAPVSYTRDRVAVIVEDEDGRPAVLIYNSCETRRGKRDVPFGQRSGYCPSPVRARPRSMHARRRRIVHQLMPSAPGVFMTNAQVDSVSAKARGG